MLSELLQRLLGRYGGGFQDDAYLLRRITQAIAEFLLEQGNVMCPGGGTLCAEGGERYNVVQISSNGAQSAIPATLSSLRSSLNRRLRLRPGWTGFAAVPLYPS